MRLANSGILATREAGLGRCAPLLSLLSMIDVISVVAGLVISVQIIIVCVLSEVFSDSDGDGAKKEIRPNAVLLLKICDVYPF